MKLNNYLLVCSVFLKLVISLFAFQTTELRAELPIQTSLEKLAKESVASIGFQNSFFEAKKRQITDSGFLFSETLSFSLSVESISVVDIPLIAHHKRCFTKKTKSRSPPVFLSVLS